MPRKNPHRSVVLTEELMESLNKYAAKKHTTVSEVIRKFVEQGLSVETYNAEQSKIRAYIREEVETTLTPYLERLIKLNAKSTRASAIAMTTVIGMLTENYTDGRTHEEMLAHAAKFAAAYLKVKVRSDEEYLQEARDLLSAMYSVGNSEGDL